MFRRAAAAASVKLLLSGSMGSAEQALVDLAGMRKKYLPRPAYGVDLNKTLLKDPMKQFDAWFQYATFQRNLTYEELNAFALSTVGADGRPSCRMVLIKGYGPDGFRFFTNYGSRKGQELSENPYACLLAYWAPINLSVRIEGIVEKLAVEATEEYWPQRPSKSRASAYASDQSCVISSREILEERVREVNEQFTDKGLEIPRPNDWGGYILKPDRFEFWQGDDNRLHDRVRFRKRVDGEDVDNYTLHQGDGDWLYERLAP